jgi:FkbM family methyltransferase
MKELFKFLLPFAVYKTLAHVYSLCLTVLDCPAAGVAMIFGEGERQHRFRRILHPFTYRMTESDRGVVMQNIVRGECVGGPMPPTAEFIVDGGGYIGDSAVVLLSLYPAATCLVFEPSSNHELAALNLHPYGTRAKLKHAMLARTHGMFQLIEAGTGTKTIATDGAASPIETWTMDDVMRYSPSGVIDVLKLDIEGAELDILRPPTPWLSSVRCLIIELHGDTAHREIPRWLRDGGFDIRRHRSLLFCNRSMK